jgi:hypothetical protein
VSIIDRLGLNNISLGDVLAVLSLRDKVRAARKLDDHTQLGRRKYLIAASEAGLEFSGALIAANNPDYADDIAELEKVFATAGEKWVSDQSGIGAPPTTEPAP